MKVLFIHCRYKLAGGEDGVVSAEVELLRANGVEVELLEFSNDGSSMLKLFQLPFNYSSYRKTRGLLKAFRPDIVHIHNLHFAASTSVLYAIKKERTAAVITLHNFRLICPSGTLYFNGNPYLKSLRTGFPWKAVMDGVYNNSKLLTFWLAFSTWFNRLIGSYNIASRYIVLTGHAKSIIQRSSLRLNSNKIVIKPNFVYDPQGSTCAHNKNFLFVGRLSEEKGISVLLDAFKHSNHLITIIGDGPLKSLVEDAARNHANISYLGFQNKEVIINELRICNALIFPSVWYETFGLTIIEAFATSTPVIASNIASPSLLVKNEFNGLHFQASDPQDLRAKLDRWQSFSEDEKQTYRTNARKSYDLYYTPEENFKHLQSIYADVLDEKKTTVRA